MEHLETMSVGQIVAKKFITAKIFDQYGIDFCCGGEVMLVDAAKKSGIALDQIVSELKAVCDEGESGQSLNFNEWSLELLVDYVIKYHHRWIREHGPRIKKNLEQVVAAHEENHPALHEVKDLFNEALNNLDSHLMKEERILFPYIYEIIRVKRENGDLLAPPFGTVANPIRMMMLEHDAEGARFKRISDLTNAYQPPADACNTYRLTLSDLKAFQKHLHEHIHIENNLIFPRAIELESK